MTESPGISLEFSATTEWMKLFLQMLAGDPSGAPFTKTEWLAAGLALGTARSAVWRVELRATPSPSFVAN